MLIISLSRVLKLLIKIEQGEEVGAYRLKIMVIGSHPESLVVFRGNLLKDMVKRGHSVTACAPAAPASVRRFLQDIHVTYQDVPVDRTGLDILSDVRTFLSFYSIYSKFKPEAVLSYTIKPVIYGSLAARAAGIPSICSMITGLGYTFFSGDRRRSLVGKLARFLYKCALHYNKTVFFQNPDDCDLFKKLHLIKGEDKAVLINGSGVDLDYFRFTAFPDNFSFLMTARLIREKGVIEYLEAARIIKTKRPLVDFRLLGAPDTGPAAISNEQLVQSIRDSGVEYVGWRDDVRPEIARASIFVLPSYGEGTPRTVLEAMSMGRPIITTDTPGCRETVQSGINGYLIPVRDVRALANAMEELLLCPQKIIEMGARSREIAIEKYDVRKVNSVILDAMGL